jgi:hypothetical protein
MAIGVTLLGGLIAGPLAAQGTAGDTAAVVELPVRYAADRYFVSPVLESGDTLLLYTDTGGGTSMLWPATAERLGLAGEWLRQGGDSARLVALPAMLPDAAIPLPSAPPPLGSGFLVIPPQGFTEGDGFLGRTWFADRVWLFDYPGRSLALVKGGVPASAPEHRVPLGFQTDSAGRRTTHFPRITAVVDGDSLDLLFDTGATVSLTPAALAALGGGGPAQRGTSFITQSVFTGWRAAHPDWRIVDSADMLGNAPMIEVPRVTVAGHEVGPVWFTVRPDRAFHEWMAQWMDRPLDGALGGSALRYFRVLVNYPEAYAAFERADDESGSAQGTR